MWQETAGRKYGNGAGMHGSFEAKNAFIFCSCRFFKASPHQFTSHFAG